MISVGIDISRLGLMIVAGQPKTASEYIQASSRVGRNRWPGLVVTCYNVHKSRDRSYYEHFGIYHASFYRHVEAATLTPFSSRALERGMAGAVAAMVRFLDYPMSPTDGVMRIHERAAQVEQIVKDFARRGAIHSPPKGRGQNVEEALLHRLKSLTDSWEQIVAACEKHEVPLSYSRFDKARTQQHLLEPPGEYMPRLPEPPDVSSDREKFHAPTSMREVEPVSHLWVHNK